MDTRLEKYYFFLSEVFATSHYQLSEKEEQLLSTVSGPAYTNWTRMIEEFIYGEEFEVVGEKLSFEEVMNLTKSLDIKTRDTAAQMLNEVLIKYLPVAEKEINSILDYKHRIDDLRGYDRPDRSAFIRDSIDSSVADVLSEITQKAYTTSQQFYALKARLLGKDTLQYHERNVPIVS
jgi:oligoendopeptidase F